MSLRLTILGCHAATPRSMENPSAQFLEINNEGFLIDCAEGTQVELRRQKVKFNKIGHVLISHLHGDHVFGLVGLISTMSLLNRQSALHIHGPVGIKELILLQLRLTKSWVDYDLYFHELSSVDSELLIDNDKVTVRTIPLKHRIYTNGFLISEKPFPRNLDMDQIRKYPEIDICDYQNLKNGKDYTLQNGNVIPNEYLTRDPVKPLRYAYCSDTAYNEGICPMIQGADLLYHESTFLEEHKELALKTGHSTARDAAKIAKLAGVKNLLLGHFSSRYKNGQLFLDEAKKEFENCSLSHTGKVIELHNTLD